MDEGGVSDMVDCGDWFGVDMLDCNGYEGEGRKSSFVIWIVFGLMYNFCVEDWLVMWVCDIVFIFYGDIDIKRLVEIY